jgi:uncharacterized membrane protein YdcZ (DUF606 family)
MADAPWMPACAGMTGVGLVMANTKKAPALADAFSISLAL